MATNKQKPNENPQNNEGREAAERKTPPEAPSKAPIIVAERTDVKRETTREASEMKREVLQMEVNPDKETPAEIEKLDTNGNLESNEQKGRFELMQTVTVTTLLPVLFKEGLKKDSIKTLENIKEVQGSALGKLNPAERVSLQKLQEIGAEPGSTLNAALKEKWNRLVETADKLYRGASKTMEDLKNEGQKPAEGKEGEKKEKPGLWSSIKNFAKKEPVATAIIAIAGTYGLYKIFKHFTTSKEERAAESKEPGFLERILGKWGKRLETTLGLGAGVFVLGRLIGSENISGWVKENLHMNISNNRISQFVVLLSDAIGALFTLNFSGAVAKLIEAVKTLISGPDEHFETHKMMAEKISQETGIKVSPETLKNVGNMRYDEFMAKAGEGKGIFASIIGVLGKIPLAGGMIQSLLGGVTGSVENVEEEQALRKYFETHQEEIGHMKNVTTTVDEVLMTLGGEEKPAPPPEAAALDPIIGKLDTPEKKAMAKEIQADMGRIIPEVHIMTIVTECKKIGVNTKKLEELLAERKQAYAELRQSMDNNAEPQEMAAKADKLFEVNNRLGVERNRMMDELMKRRGWTELQVLGITHLPKAINWYFQPEYKKQYGKYLMEKYIKAPFKIGKKAMDMAKGIPSQKLIGREFKENATIEEIQEDIARTTTERNEAKQSLERANIEQATPTTGKSSDEMKQEIAHEQKKVDLLEQDLKIHNQRKIIAEKETKLLGLKDAPVAERSIVEKEIKENKEILRSMNHERFKFQNDFVVQEIIDYKKQLIKDFGVSGKEGELKKSHLEEMDRMQETIGIHDQQIEREIASLTKTADEITKAGKDPKPIIREIVGLQETRAKINIGAVEDFQKIAVKSWKKWELRGAFKGGATASPEVRKAMEQERNQLQKQLYKISKGRESAEGMGKGIFKTLKGKMYFYGAFIAAGSTINLMDKKQGEDWSKSIEQAAVDTLPLISTYSDVYSAVKGEEIVTRRKLDATDRAMRALFAAGSALCDVTQFAGAFMRLRAAFGTMKEAKATGKSIKFAEGLKAMKQAGKEIDSVQALREMSQTGHWINKVAMGGALGLAGYSLVYMPIAEIELKPETKAMLGDSVQDLDIEPPKIDHPIKPLGA